MTPAPAPLHRRPPAEAWRRIAARVVDAATVATILWVLVVLRVLWFVPALTARFQPDPWGRGFVATISFVVLAVVYESVFVSRSAGQTPGMDLLCVRVVGPGDEGATGATRAVARVLPLLAVPVVRPAWAAVALLAACGASLAVPGRRPVLDVLTGTIVVPYDRDREDPTARHPLSRHRRRAIERDDVRRTSVLGSMPSPGHAIGETRGR